MKFIYKLGTQYNNPRTLLFHPTAALPVRTASAQFPTDPSTANEQMATTREGLNNEHTLFSRVLYTTMEATYKYSDILT